MNGETHEFLNLMMSYMNLMNLKNLMNLAILSQKITTVHIIANIHAYQMLLTAIPNKGMSVVSLNQPGSVKTPSIVNTANMYMRST